jgi:hypothetical protein
MWTVWNKKDEINGFSADFILERNKHLANEETIFLKSINGRVTQIEGKMILASVYGIDDTLSNDEFIAEYERTINAYQD